MSLCQRDAMKTSYTDECEEQQLLSILINISCDRD